MPSSTLQPRITEKWRQLFLKIPSHVSGVGPTQHGLAAGRPGRRRRRLQELEEQDPAKAWIVLLRYFSGLTTAETAEVPGVAERTLDRQWLYLRAWLLKRLG